MNRQPVESSNIHSVGYDPEKNILEVQFSMGGVYRYHDVPAKVHADMMAAESVGKYFGSHVRNDYKTERVNTSKE